MAAVDAEHGPGNQHVRPFHVTIFDGIPQSDIRITVCADIAHGGEPRQQSRARVPDSGDGRTRNGDPQPFISGAARIDGEMNVSVNQAGQTRTA
jgi:hypothetical protein